MPITNMISDCDNTLNKKLINYLVPILSALFAVSVAEPLCFSNDAMAQGRVRVTTLAGGTVPFYFNSMEKYQNGINYSDYTVFGITIEDTCNLPPADYSWEFRAEATTALINGDGGNTLDLNTLELTASDVFGNLIAEGAIFSPTLPLTFGGGGTLLVEDLSVIAPPDPEPLYTTHQISITYDCGRSITVANNLINDQNARADYYVVDIEFTLYVDFTLPPCP